MDKRTPAREKVEEMEIERTFPMAMKLAKETPIMSKSPKDAVKTALTPVAAMVDMVTGPKRRSEEDMSELTREVARGNKMAKGGKVSSASARADGIAQRGKTRGKMC